MLDGRAGEVEMRPHPEYERFKRARITAAGYAFRDKAIEGPGPYVARLSARLPVDEAAALIPGLEELRRIPDEDRD